MLSLEAEFEFEAELLAVVLPLAGVEKPEHAVIHTIEDRTAIRAAH
jgi:hypothetical protein